MKPTTLWRNQVFFGRRYGDGANIALSAPSWDCDWYWGFGYLGNHDEHYHLKNYQQPPHSYDVKRNINMHDALLEDYDLNDRIKNNLWTFCELSLTIYTLKETAEVLGRGGSHMTNNPCKDVIINTDEVTRINNVVLPTLFDTMYNLFVKNDD